MNNLTNNVVEGLITGEAIGLDKRGAEYCMLGFVNTISKSERFVLKNPEAMELKGTGTSSFPIPLDWNQVKSICQSYGGDVLVVLETFDSDSRRFVGDPVKITRRKKGVKVKKLSYPATLIMEIESGWRIYDLNNKEIIDENKFTEIKEFSAWGDSKEIALMGLPSKREAIKESGLFAGQKYSFRISPAWMTVSRRYYSSKIDEFKTAKGYVKKGDWNNAIDIWMTLIDDPNIKISRRATFNMAIASEVKGALDTAIDWANKARELGEARANNYINILSKRKIDENKLKQQLNN